MGFVSVHPDFGLGRAARRRGGLSGIPRGLGATCASYGPLPAGYACVDSAGGNATLIPPGGSFTASDTGSVGQVGPVDCSLVSQALSFDPSLASLMPAQCMGAGGIGIGTIALVASVLLVVGVLVNAR